MLLAVVPAALVAIICIGAALAAFHGSLTEVDHVSGLLVLVGALVLVLCVVLGAAFSAAAQERAIAVRATARQATLCRFAVRGHAHLAELLYRVKHQQSPLQRPGDPLPASSGPLFDSFIQEIAAAQLGTEAAVLEVAGQLRAPVGPAARPVVERPVEDDRRPPVEGESGELLVRPEPVVRVPQPQQPAGRRDERVDGGGERPEPGGSPEQSEVFANLSHRLQSLVHREIGLLDELENEIEDPDFLKRIFQVDHLATRVRRYAENLAVLGGAGSSRQWTRSIGIGDIFRSAVAEIEQYSRVKLVPPLKGTVRGHAVVDIVHLLAELVENATMFSAPQTQVLLRLEPVAAGLAIEVEDRGLGIEPAERAEMNALLADPRGFGPGERLRDGRVGLYVVASLAWRHGISVQLQGNIYGGTQAVLVLPRSILGEEVTAEPPQQIPADPPPRPEQQLASPPRPEQLAPRPQRDHAPVERQAPSGYPAHPAPPADGPPPSLPLTTAPPLPLDSGAAARGPRPVLPTRLRQESLAPELRRQPVPAPPEEVEHTAGLVAAFFTGTRRAQESEEFSDDPRGPGGEDDHGE